MTFQFNLNGCGRSATPAGGSPARRSVAARSPAVTPRPAHLEVARRMIKCLSLLTALLAVSASAMAENASIVGTWTLAAADKILPDGSRVPDYGPNPHGLVIFTANGDELSWKVTPRQDGSVPITVLRRVQ
jgi:hypothetical protein